MTVKTEDDLLATARAGLAASTTSDGAVANALERAREEIKQLEAVLVRRERELSHAATPRRQESLELDAKP